MSVCVCVCVCVLQVASRDPEARELLQSSVEELQTACASAVSVSQRRAALRRLRASAKNAYAANVQLIAASFGARAFNPDESSLADLLRHCEVRRGGHSSSGVE